MKYTINNYQVIYESGARDKIKLDVPIYTDDIETERAKLKMKHTSHGRRCVGCNLDYVEHNIEKK